MCTGFRKLNRDTNQHECEALLPLILSLFLSGSLRSPALNLPALSLSFAFAFALLYLVQCVQLRFGIISCRCRLSLSLPKNNTRVDFECISWGRLQEENTKQLIDLQQTQLVEPTVHKEAHEFNSLDPLPAKDITCVFVYFYLCVCVCVLVVVVRFTSNRPNYLLHTLPAPSQLGSVQGIHQFFAVHSL